ncbi:hypothetical protein IF2G_00784 [Cordyceps javanica]|nr:hypothetical protein IF2G_00784 [Cordyceps javanica]
MVCARPSHRNTHIIAQNRERETLCIAELHSTCNSRLSCVFNLHRASGANHAVVPDCKASGSILTLASMWTRQHSLGQQNDGLSAGISTLDVK